MSANLEVRKIEPGTSEYRRPVATADTRIEEIRSDDKRTWPTARSLRRLVDLWGGWSKTLKAPDRTEHDVSLLPWREEDPDTTFIVIRIELVDWSPPGAQALRP